MKNFQQRFPNNIKSINILPASNILKFKDKNHRIRQNVTQVSNGLIFTY
jgi:hypothetical protein